MPRHVARIVLVGETDPTGSERHTRYAVLDDGERIQDPGFFGGGCSWSLFGWNERDEGWVELMREKDQADARRLGLLSAALAEAGIDADPSELAALPVDIEFEKVDRFPSSMTPRQERRLKIQVFLVSVLIGAIWPSWIRRNVPTRQNWRRLLRRGIAGWAVSNAVKEMGRRRQG